MLARIVPQLDGAYEAGLTKNGRQERPYQSVLAASVPRVGLFNPGPAEPTIAHLSAAPKRCIVRGNRLGLTWRFAILSIPVNRK